jgi:hypothetical protein
MFIIKKNKKTRSMQSYRSLKYLSTLSKASFNAVTFSGFSRFSPQFQQIIAKLSSKNTETPCMGAAILATLVSRDTSHGDFKQYGGRKNNEIMH